MACGRPVILGVDGQARQILDEAQAGVFIEPEDPVALVQAIVRLYHDARSCEILGRNGRRFIVEHLSRQETANVYTRTLEKVIWNSKQDHS